MFVAVKDVSKDYGSKLALDHVSFTAEKGRVLGILGENGAGKSTLFRIISSVTKPSGGSVTVEGRPVGLESRKITAFVPEINPFYDWMRVMEQLEFLSAFYEGWDMAKTKELLKFLGLPEKDKIGTLSKGQQVKLKMAFAFSWPAKLILLDEPLSGIDLVARKMIIGTLFNEYRYGEQTIMMSTHLVNEVEEFFEDVIYLRNGKIALSGSADNLREEKGKSLVGIFEEIYTE